MRSSLVERTYYPRQLWNVSGDEWRPMMMMMMVVVMMLTSTNGEHCDVTRTNPKWCNGTSGLPVYLVVSSSAVTEIKLHKGDKGVFTYNNNMMVFHNNFRNPAFENRWKFVADNGTLIINPAERSDSALYKVEIYDKKGIVTPHTVELKIEGSASGVVLPAVVCVLVILVCLCVTAGVFYVRKNRHTRTAAQTPDSQGELHYADISVLAIHQRQQREAEKPQHTQEPVYSMVQHRS